MDRMNWRTSSYSTGNGECVEAGNAEGTVLIRDTQDAGRGPVLRVTPAEWQRFTKSIRG